MIVDKIDNLCFYSDLLQNLKAGFDAIEKLGKDPALGRYEFEGGFFMVQEGTTTPLEDGMFEAHREYIDVQMILEGSEEMAWQGLTDLTVVQEYNPKKDVTFLTGDFDHVIKITAGMAYIVFPEDGHRPGAHTKEPQSYKKIVLKLH